ncbi:hypothetical protein PV721_35420 [Streptomyces sp. MB09-01]|uniref:hypothetical protein n=1 Tax=Streptomyces sp. MB09-01 TaxID=3028666 RepID=UPI0029BB2FB9|nr:hypothetical protein [Streptomyces sp. MB09-01]MDX3539525.1 hypothetical protein [Streptomyces sp. MB09-01]
MVARGLGAVGKGFSAASNVSDTRDTTPNCGPGRGPCHLVLHPVVPTARDGRSATGTKVSRTADTAPTCGRGDGNFNRIPLLSGTKALSRT